MSDILSQSEIEALLNSLGESPAPEEMMASNAPMAPFATPGAPGGNNRPGRSTQDRNLTRASAIAYEMYDFRRPDKFSKEQLRTLQMIHETFARLAGTGLSAYLRTPVNFDLISLEQVPYEEYLRSINQSVFTILSLSPLSGQAVCEIEFQLIFSMIDRLLGGPGRSINRTVLTDIERPLMRNMVERMFMGLKSAWEGIVIINPSIEGVETSSQFVQIAPPNDIVVTILFEVRVGDARGAMSLCVPYLVLKPITAKLSAQKWFVSSNRKVSTAHRRMITTQIQGAKVDCAVKLGKIKVNTREFLKLRAGDVLQLDQQTNKDLVFEVGDLPKFKGRPTINGRKYIFTISHAADPL